MASVALRSIEKRFGDAVAVAGVDLEVPAGEFLTLLGPSGCGKSTLLRIIAGLEPQTAGTVAIDGEPVDDLRPKRRDVAMVFQSYALYPHMTVRENLATPLRMRRTTRAQRLPLFGRLSSAGRAEAAAIDATVREVAETLGIGPLLDRKPAQLSGGQRQRVAVGRALVRRPKVFLMDEPLSNLDATLRVQMRTEIKDLHRRLGITFLYVTHDQSEAMTMSDRVAVMMEGRILQAAPPRELYERPADVRVAAFVGAPRINLLAGGIDAAGRAVVGGSGSPVTIGVRPEALVPAAPAAPGALVGPVRAIEDMGPDLYVHFDLAGQAAPVVARLDPADRHRISMSTIASFVPRPGAVTLFGPDGRRMPAAADVPTTPTLAVVTGGR